MTEHTMRDEEYVRAAWTDSILNNGLWLYSSSRAYQLRIGGRQFRGTFKNKESVWSDARKFTEERQEQIRQIEEEISWLDSLAEFDKGKYWIGCESRAQAVLAELKRGLR